MATDNPLTMLGRHCKRGQVLPFDVIIFLPRSVLRSACGAVLDWGTSDMESLTHPPGVGLLTITLLLYVFFFSAFFFLIMLNKNH